MIRRRTFSMPENTVWPDALPRPNEDFYFTVYACNDSQQVWGFHDANNDEEGTIWSNPSLDEKYFHDSNITVSDRVADFSSYVSIEDQPGVCNPRDYIFGGNRPTSMESASWEAVSRGCKITVYVVGTNTLQLQLISKLFASIPSRLFFMKSTDFFSSSEGNNQNIRIERLAALRGVAHCNGFPSILFDAGDTLTYTAADEQGHILGEGISPGLLSIVNCARKRNGLFLLSSEELDDMLKDVDSGEQPLQIFSNSTTTESILAAALSDVSSHATNVVKMWLEKVGSKKKMKKQSNGRKLNLNRVVYVTGKHAPYIEKLLQRNNGCLIESPHHKGDVTINTYVSESMSQFIPHGIQNVIHYCKGKKNSYISGCGTKVITPSRSISTGTSSTVASHGGRKRRQSREDSICKKSKFKGKYVKGEVSSILTEKIKYAESCIGKKIAKYFPESESVYNGEVIGIRVMRGRVYCCAEYSDGDTEDLNMRDVKIAIALHHSRK